jgi:hypothetical protein
LSFWISGFESRVLHFKLIALHIYKLPGFLLKEILMKHAS